MNDDLLLSLYIDGRLPDDQCAAFERRLAAEPALRARLEAMRRLQALSAGLAPVNAAFSADDVRVRAEARPRGGWRGLGLAAAAVLALAVTHAAVYWAGARRGAEAERAERASIEETAALLERAAEVDIAAPPSELKTELATLRRRIPTQIDLLSRAKEPEAARYADALRQIRVVFEQQPDPAFAFIQLKAIVTSLDSGAQVRLVPASAREYYRLLPAEDGRYQLIVVEDVNGTPKTTVEEGTPEELEARLGVRRRMPAPKEK